MTNIFAIGTSTRTVGFAVRVEARCCFYASDHAPAGLEGRRCSRDDTLLQVPIGSGVIQCDRTNTGICRHGEECDDDRPAHAGNQRKA